MKQIVCLLASLLFGFSSLVAQNGSRLLPREYSYINHPVITYQRISASDHVRDTGLVVWMSAIVRSPGDTTSQLVGQIFVQDRPDGDPFPITSADAHPDQFLSVLGVDSGFVVFWNDYRGNGGTGFYRQQVSRTGTLVGDEVQINTGGYKVWRKYGRAEHQRIFHASSGQYNLLMTFDSAANLVDSWSIDTMELSYAVTSDVWIDTTLLFWKNSVVSAVDEVKGEVIAVAMPDDRLIRPHVYKRDGRLFVLRDSIIDVYSGLLEPAPARRLTIEVPPDALLQKGILTEDPDGNTQIVHPVVHDPEANQLPSSVMDTFRVVIVAQVVDESAIPLSVDSLTVMKVPQSVVSAYGRDYRMRQVSIAYLCENRWRISAEVEFQEYFNSSPLLKYYGAYQIIISDGVIDTSKGGSPATPCFANVDMHYHVQFQALDSFSVIVVEVDSSVYSLHSPTGIASFTDTIEVSPSQWNPQIVQEGTSAYLYCLNRHTKSTFERFYFMPSLDSVRVAIAPDLQHIIDNLGQNASVNGPSTGPTFRTSMYGVVGEQYVTLKGDVTRTEMVQEAWKGTFKSVGSRVYIAAVPESGQFYAHFQRQFNPAVSWVEPLQGPIPPPDLRLIADPYSTAVLAQYSMVKPATAIYRGKHANYLLSPVNLTCCPGEIVIDSSTYIGRKGFDFYRVEPGFVQMLGTIDSVPTQSKIGTLRKLHDDAFLRYYWEDSSRLYLDVFDYTITKVASRVITFRQPTQFHIVDNPNDGSLAILWADSLGVWSMPFDTRLQGIGSPTLQLAEDDIHSFDAVYDGDSLLVIWSDSSETTLTFYWNRVAGFVRPDPDKPFDDSVKIEERDPVAGDEVTMMNLYPNPVHSILNLDYTAEGTTSIDVALYDLLGNEVLARRGVSVTRGAMSLQFDVGSLPGGSYQVVVKSDAFRLVEQIWVIGD